MSPRVKIKTVGQLGNLLAKNPAEASRHPTNVSDNLRKQTSSICSGVPLLHDWRSQCASLAQTLLHRKIQMLEALNIAHATRRAAKATEAVRHVPFVGVIIPRQLLASPNVTQSVQNDLALSAVQDVYGHCTVWPAAMIGELYDALHIKVLHCVYLKCVTRRCIHDFANFTQELRARWYITRSF